MVGFVPVEKDLSRLEASVDLSELDIDIENGLDAYFFVTDWSEQLYDNTFTYLTTYPFRQPSRQHNTRASNPYISSHNHPIHAVTDESVKLDPTELDDDAPGDGVYELPGKDFSYAWIECLYNGTEIPAGSTINNLTVFMGYRNDAPWTLAPGHWGLIWSATSGGTEHNIANYTLSTTDRDDIFTITTDLPSLSEFNKGIYLRVSGRDSDGGSWDYLDLDYLYFTLNYSLPEIVINEIMYDPPGDDNNSEWVELYNAGSGPVDLTGWSLADNDGNIFSLDGAGTLSAGGYLVCHLASGGTNSSTDVYGWIISEVVIQPDPTTGKDNFLHENWRNVNYGTNTNLTLENTTKEQRPIIEFSVASVPASGVFSSEVMLYSYDGDPDDDHGVNVHRVTQTWTEAGSNWDDYDWFNNWPVNINGGDYDPTTLDTTTVLGGGNRWYAWDITDLTKAWKNSSLNNYGLIFIGEPGTPLTDFYSSDFTGDTSLRPKMVVKYYNTSAGSVLDDSDDLALLDNNDYVVDYVAWGAGAGADDDVAVSAGQWTDGAYVDTTPISEGESLGRDKASTDTDTPADWHNGTTSQADPYGVHSTIVTQGMRNVWVIPEFDEYVVGLMSIAVIMIIIIGKRSKRREAGR